MTAPNPPELPTTGVGLLRAGLQRTAVLLGVALALLLPTAGVAAAEPPLRLAAQLTDSAGVLSDSDKADIQNAMTELDKDKNIQLWVVYTKTFDGQTGQQWATRTGELSGFGSSNLMLAVAVDDRAYGYYRPAGFPLSDSEVQSIMDKSVRPKLTADDWAGAAIALATELGGGSGSAPLVGRRWRRGDRRRWLPVLPQQAEEGRPRRGRTESAMVPASPRSRWRIWTRSTSAR